MKRQIVVIVGPTAVGKTKYTLSVARILKAEIVSADSMQLYKYMDIGSAKPTKEELEIVKHHLVDTVDPRIPWSVAEYQKLAKTSIEDILARGKLPIVSGGTGLYVNSLLYDMDFSVMPRRAGFREQLEQDALIHGKEWVHNRLRELDPVTSERIHPNNLKKVIRAIEVYENTGEGIPQFIQSFQKTQDYNWVLIGLNRDRNSLYDRINHRVDLLIEAGLVEEVQNLLEMGLTEENISMKGIGYKEIIGHLKDKYSLEEAIQMIKQNTRNYAKRQITWFKRYPEIKWFDIKEDDSQQVTQGILSYLNEQLSVHERL